MESNHSYIPDEPSNLSDVDKINENRNLYQTNNFSLIHPAAQQNNVTYENRYHRCANHENTEDRFVSRKYSNYRVKVPMPEHFPITSTIIFSLIKHIYVITAK